MPGLVVVGHVEEVASLLQLLEHIAGLVLVVSQVGWSIRGLESICVLAFLGFPLILQFAHQVVSESTVLGLCLCLKSSLVAMCPHT